MFLHRIGHAFCLQGLESADDTEPGITRLDHIVDVAVRGCFVWIGESSVVFCFFFRDEFCLFLLIVDSGYFLAVLAPLAPITAS